MFAGRRDRAADQSQGCTRYQHRRFDGQIDGRHDGYSVEQGHRLEKGCTLEEENRLGLEEESYIVHLPPEFLIFEGVASLAEGWRLNWSFQQDLPGWKVSGAGSPLPPTRTPPVCGI